MGLLRDIFLIVVLSAHSALSAMPRLQTLDAKCGRSGMSVSVAFDLPFPGIIYSKGHYSDPACHYVTSSNAGKRAYTFRVPTEGCGTHSSTGDIAAGKDMFYENIIIIQLDPLITEVWDSARLLRCVSPNSLSRTVKAEPFRVASPRRVDLTFTEASVNTLSKVQLGSGPFDAPVSGYVHMGEQTSLVVYVQDSSKSRDVNLVNCSLSTARGDVALLDQFGCPAKPDRLTEVEKSLESNGVKADLMLYAYFKDLSLTQKDSFSLHCQLEVCDGRCSEPCQDGDVFVGRRKRSAGETPLLEDVSEERPELLGARLHDEVFIVGAKAPPCGLSTVLVLTVSVLLGVLAVLSVLCCCLAYQLFHRQPKSTVL